MLVHQAADVFDRNLGNIPRGRAWPVFQPQRGPILLLDQSLQVGSNDGHFCFLALLDQRGPAGRRFGAQRDEALGPMPDDR